MDESEVSIEWFIKILQLLDNVNQDVYFWCQLDSVTDDLFLQGTITWTFVIFQEEPNSRVTNVVKKKLKHSNYIKEPHKFDTSSFPVYCRNSLVNGIMDDILVTYFVIY